MALRFAFPDKKILLAKYDFSGAYHRVAHVGKAAAQSILILGEVTYVALRLSFGGALSPPPTWWVFVLRNGDGSLK
jgi:hypothetical protein